MRRSHPWWRHQMETFSALLAICAGNSPVTGEFPEQRPVTRSFDAFFDLRLNKRLSKQWRGWWFETPSRTLWRHCNDCDIYETFFWKGYFILSSSVDFMIVTIMGISFSGGSIWLLFLCFEMDVCTVLILYWSIGNMSALFQVMVWHLSSNKPSCWAGSTTPHGVARLQWVKPMMNMIGWYEISNE